MRASCSSACLQANAEGGQVEAAGDGLTIRNADAVTLLLTAGTNYRLHYPDFRSESVRRAPTPSKPYAQLRHDHIDAHRRLFRRVELESGRRRPLRHPHRRAAGRHAAGRRRSATARDLLPVRPLPAAIEFAAGHSARQPARHLGRRPDAAVAGRLSRQHQHPDELLAGRGVQPFRMPRARSSISSTCCASRAAAPPRSRTAAAAGWRTTPPTSGAAPRSRGLARYAMWQGASGWLAQHFWEHYAFTGDRAVPARRAPGR